jgi:hypothetical protein
LRPPCDIAFPDRQLEEQRSRTRTKQHFLPAAGRHAISTSKIWRYSRHLIETAANAAHKLIKKKKQKADGANPGVNHISSINTGDVARGAYPAAEGEEQLQVLLPSADEMQAPPHDLVATPSTPLMQRRATNEGYPSPQTKNEINK